MMLYPSSAVMVSSDTITATHSHCKSAHSALTMDESRFGRFYYAWLHWVYPIVVPSALCFPRQNSHMRLHPLSLQSQSPPAFRPPLLISYLGLDPPAVMPHGGHRKRGRSRRGGVVEHHTHSIVALVVEAYEAHTPPHIRVELDLAEVDARVLRRFIDHAAVDEEIGQWIPDPGSYREHATLYTKTVDLYWLLKTMMGKVLVEWNKAHEEIFLQLDEMRMEILGLGRKMDRLLNSNSDEVGPSHGHANAVVGAPPGSPS
jgi:hypothetical protein